MLMATQHSVSMLARLSLWQTRAAPASGGHCGTAPLIWEMLPDQIAATMQSIWLWELRGLTPAHNYRPTQPIYPGVRMLCVLPLWWGGQKNYQLDCLLSAPVTLVVPASAFVVLESMFVVPGLLSVVAVLIFVAWALTLRSSTATSPCVLRTKRNSRLLGILRHQIDLSASLESRHLWSESTAWPPQGVGLSWGWYDPIPRGQMIRCHQH